MRQVVIYQCYVIVVRVSGDYESLSRMLAPACGTASLNSAHLAFPFQLDGMGVVGVHATVALSLSCVLFGPHVKV